MKVYVIYNSIEKRILGSYRNECDAKNHPRWGFRDGTRLKELEVLDSIHLPNHGEIHKLIFEQ